MLSVKGFFYVFCDGEKILFLSSLYAHGTRCPSDRLCLLWLLRVSLLQYNTQTGICQPIVNNFFE